MLQLRSLVKPALRANHARLMSTATGGAVYMVVGANGGIGSHLCSRILRGNPDARVAVACRNKDAMSQLIDTLGAEANAKDRILAVQVRFDFF
jgi:NAD(P)-dependent dehydrogenase (short-subunit alcohol dehydrogenase family)